MGGRPALPLRRLRRWPSEKEGTWGKICQGLFRGWLVVGEDLLEGIGEKFGVPVDGV